MTVNNVSAALSLNKLFNRIYPMSQQEKTLHNQIIALGAVAQAATLIDKLARTGYEDKEPFKTLVHGLLETSPPSTAAVYVDAQHLRMGLETLRYLLQQGDTKPNANQNYSEIMRYCLSILHLERKLGSHPAMLATIGKRLEQVKHQTEHFRPANEAGKIHGGFLHESVLANIASIYTDTLSTLKFRVQVNGNPTYLQQELIVHKIRSLLLCGIRAAVLWKQVGGGRLSILLKRKQYAQITSEMLRLH